MTKSTTKVKIVILAPANFSPFFLLLFSSPSSYTVFTSITFAHSSPLSLTPLNPVPSFPPLSLALPLPLTSDLTMRFLNPQLTLLFLSACLLLSSLSLSLSSSIHDLLRSRGLPAGLLPREIKSYTLSDDGRLEVLLDGPCLAKFENRVFFDSVVTANLTYGSLIGVVGLSQEELFLWLPVKDIIVDDPDSGLILFDIGVAHKQLSLSLFEDPPDCKPQQGVLMSHVRKEKGLEARR